MEKYKNASTGAWNRKTYDLSAEIEREDSQYIFDYCPSRLGISGEAIFGISDIGAKITN